MRSINKKQKVHRAAYDSDKDRCVVVYEMQVDYRVTITQTGKHQGTLFVLSLSTDPSLHCLLDCLVVKYPVHNESQKLGPSVSRCVSILHCVVIVIPPLLVYCQFQS